MRLNLRAEAKTIIRQLNERRGTQPLSFCDFVRSHHKVMIFEAPSPSRAPANRLFLYRRCFTLLRMKRASTALVLLTLCLFSARTITCGALSAQKETKTGEFVDGTKSSRIKWGIKQLAPGVQYLVDTIGG